MTGDITKIGGAKREVSAPNEIAKFLETVRALPAVERASHKPRLIFAMDATESRSRTWDIASKLQGDMACAAGDEGLEVALAYFRGYGECRITPKYYVEPQEVAKLMGRIQTQGGCTQIGKILNAFLDQAKQHDGARVAVFVGDAFEEQPNIDGILHKAGQLKALGFRVFMFQEGNDPYAKKAFTQIAESTGGLYATFDEGSASQLRDLIRSIASYVAKRPPPALTSGSPSAAAFQKGLRALPPPN